MAKKANPMKLKVVVTGDNEIVNRDAIARNKDIVSVVLEEGVKIIDECAFASCVNLTEIVLPSTLERINERAFYNCKSLARIYIPKGVVEILGNAFSGCDSLEIFCEGEVGDGWIDEVRTRQTTIYSAEEDAFNFHRSSGGWDGHTVEYTIVNKWNPDNRPVHTNVSREQYDELCKK